MRKKALSWAKASLGRMTLGKKLVLLIIVGLALGGTVFALLAMQALHRSTDAMLQERLTTTRLVSKYADEVLERAITELKQTASETNFDDTYKAASRIATLESTYSKMSIRVLDIFVLDNSARVMWDSIKGTLSSSEDMSSYPCFADVVGSQPCVSGLMYAPVIGIPSILLSSGLQQGAGVESGIIVTAIDLTQSSIGGFIQPISLGETGYVEIVDQKGIVIARTEPGHPLTPFEESDHQKRFAELIATGNATTGTCHACHREGKQVSRRDVLAFVPIQQAPWGVAIRQSENEALAPTRSLRLNLFTAGAAMFAVFLLFAGILTQNIVRRVRGLTGASLRIAHGGLDVPVAPMGRDEIGVLAETLESMRLNLNESYKELQRHEEARRDLLRVMMTAQEEERRRIARELHDETSQALASFTVNLETTIAALPGDAKEANVRLRELQARVVKTLEGIHDVVYELRPTVLDDLGLVAAVRWQLENVVARSGVETQFETEGDERRLPQATETAVFRIIQEASNNIVRHAGAETATITLTFSQGALVVHIEDDGKGFDVREMIDRRKGSRGLGLLGMRERAESLGGTMQVWSEPGSGTKIDISIPLTGGDSI
jgi:signal transduction histidine kinase